jgi:hypothetical protein
LQKSVGHCRLEQRGWQYGSASVQCPLLRAIQVTELEERLAKLERAEEEKSAAVAEADE